MDAGRARRASCSPPISCRWAWTARTLNLLHHPTGTEVTRDPDWVVLAVPPNPVEWLYHDLKAAGVSVERVGDCVAPRRAHGAVIEGEHAAGSAI